MPKYEKKEAEVPTAANDDAVSRVFTTSNEAQLASLINQAGDGGYDLGKLGRLTAGDVYGDRWAFQLPECFDTKRASGIYRSPDPPFRDDFRRHINPREHFHYTIANRANAHMWAKDGEVPDFIFDANGAVIMDGQILLWRPMAVTRKFMELRDQRSRMKNGGIMGKDKNGTEAEPGVQNFYREGGDAAAIGNEVVFAERSDVPEGAGIGLDDME